MAYNILSGTVSGLTTGSIALTGTFSGSLRGDGSQLKHVPGPDTVVDADDNRLITFTSATGKTLRGESNLIFTGDTLYISGASDPKIVLDVSGNISASQNISAAFYYGDGRYLSGITASGGGGSANAQGPAGSLQFQTGSGGISGSAEIVFRTGSSDLLVNSGLIHARVLITASYTASTGQYYLAVSATAPVAILFDAASCTGGQTYVVKDEGGNASISIPISLIPSASQKIDGQGELSIVSPFGAVNMYTNGSHWFIY